MIRFVDDPALETSHPPITSDPSPAQIRAMCWAIQATWSPDETQRRAGVYVRRPVEVDVVSMAEVVAF